MFLSYRVQRFPLVGVLHKLLKKKQYDTNDNAIV